MRNVALITGAAGGIGKEFSRLHASKGGDIVAVDLNSEGLKDLKNELEKEYRIRVYPITKNLANESATLEIYQEVKEQKIEVEYLINNAGFGGVGLFHERAWEKDLAMIKVNIVALRSLTRWFLPDFIKRDASRVLNTSSTLSLIPGPGQAVYFATKAFVTSFSQSLYGEVSDTNVSVTALLPGPTQTGFGDHSGMNKTSIYSKTAKASDVAREGYEAMMKGEVQVISGLPFSDRMQMKLVPFLPKKMLINKIKKGQETK